MISLHSLSTAMDGDRVAFDRDGMVLDVEIPADAGPATLLVSPVTDALKRVEAGRLVESVDRGEMWLVQAIILERHVLDSLGEVSVSAEDLLEMVPAAGYDWAVSSTSGL